jgi:hypothetical protein
MSQGERGGSLGIETDQTGCVVSLRPQKGKKSWRQVQVYVNFSRPFQGQLLFSFPVPHPLISPHPRRQQERGGILTSGAPQKLAC